VGFLVLYWVCVARFWYQGAYRGAFCKKLPEACPVSNKDKANQLQDASTTGQGQANQRWWYHFCVNIFKKKKKKTSNPA